MLLGAGDGFDGPDRSQMLCEGRTLMAHMPSCLSEVHFRAGSRNEFTPKTRGEELLGFTPSTQASYSGMSGGWRWFARER